MKKIPANLTRPEPTHLPHLIKMSNVRDTNFFTTNFTNC